MIIFFSGKPPEYVYLSDRSFKDLFKNDLKEGMSKYKKLLFEGRGC